MQNTYFLCGGPIQLCSIVVIYLGDFDIGLCHPLIVQCIHVCIMKVFMMMMRERERERVGGGGGGGRRGSFLLPYPADELTTMSSTNLSVMV